MSKEIIYYRETNWQSIVADTYMFATLIGAMAANHYWFGDSAVWAFLLWLMTFATIVGRATSKRHRFGSKEEIISHLNQAL